MLWDDPGHVTRPDLRTGAGLLRIWTDVHATQQYYPVLHSAFWFEHRLWGDATLGYHLLNIALHALSCCLLARLMRRLWSAAPASAVPPGTEWWVAMLFAVHPLCVESVAWISEQKNTLSLVFYLLAGLAYWDFAGHRRWRSYGWASLWFFLAVGTKTVTSTLPAALLVVLWWKDGKLSWRKDVGPLVPWFGLAIGAGTFTAWAERTLIGAEGVQFELTALQRLMLAGRVIWFYAGKLLWPAHQAFFYARWNVPDAAEGWIGYLAAAVAVTAVLWAVRRRTRGPLAGWLVFVGSLFPALGFFNVYPFVFSYVADHFQYLASVAFIATATGAAAVGLARAPRSIRRLGLCLGAGLVAGLAILANRQSRLYVDDPTLFRATLAESPDSWMAHHILGFHLAMAEAPPAAAIAEYRAALAINPDYPDAHIGLAIELAKLPDRRAEAIAHYQRALELKPNASDTADAHNDLAVLLATDPDRRAEAIAHYQTALRLKPDFAEAHANLANALAGLPGRLPEALTHFEAALRLDPDSPEMHDSYGNALAAVPARRSEALAQFETALRLNPRYAGAHADLGQLLAGIPGREAEALDHFSEALRLDATLAVAQFNWANLLTRMPGREAEAIEHYEASLRLNPEVAPVHLALAILLSAMPERSAEAAVEAEAALRLQPDYAAAHNCLGVIYVRAGRPADARREWEAALRLNPGYDTARANLRRLDELTGRSGGD